MLLVQQHLATSDASSVLVLLLPVAELIPQEKQQKFQLQQQQRVPRHEIA